jgi:hypothetical protein
MFSVLHMIENLTKHEQVKRIEAKSAAIFVALAASVKSQVCGTILGLVTLSLRFFVSRHDTVSAN